MSTRKADTMTGTPQADDIRGKNGGDTMLARGGADRLLGGNGDDPDISAGSGNDSVARDGGDDSLSGEEGDDTYFFDAGWGADRIPADGEGAGMGTDTLDFSPLPGGTPLLDPLALDIDLDSSADRDEVFTVFSDAGKQMLNFPAAVEIENVTGGGARDVIRGNGLPNHLSGKGGDDTLLKVTLPEYLRGFLLPTTLGNIVGGVVLVTLLNFGQVIGSRKKTPLSGVTDQG